MTLTEEEKRRMQAQIAALSQMESAGGDISGMTLDNISPPRAPQYAEPAPPPQEAFIISRPEPRDVEVPAMPDMELRAAKNADVDAFNKRALETGFRQLVAGLTGTRAPDAVTPFGTGEADLRARRRAMEVDALRRMEAENNAARTGAYLEAQTKMGLGREQQADISTRRLEEVERANKAKEELERLRIDYKKEADAKRAAAGAAARKSKADAADEKSAEKAKAKGWKDVSELRKEFNAQPIVKGFGTQRQEFEKMKTAVNNPSAAGDLVLIFSLMKVLDPNSTVREGEFAQAQAAGGISDRVRSHIGKVMAGERLTPEQRQDFLSQATNVFAAARAQYDEQASRYRDLASKIGGDPDDVVKTGQQGAAPSSAGGTVKVRQKKTGNVKTLSAADAARFLAKPDEFEEVK